MPLRVTSHGWTVGWPGRKVTTAVVAAVHTRTAPPVVPPSALVV